MEESTLFGEDLPLPPARLFERLGQLPGYTWDQTIEPFHSTYNHWHISGYRHALEPDVLTPLANSSNPASSGPSSLTRFSPRTEIRPSARALRRLSASETSSDISFSNQHSLETEQTWIPVIARISTNIIRLEREFHMLRSIVQSSDPDCNHTIRPVDLIRLQSDDAHSKTLLVAIFESPGCEIWSHLAPPHLWQGQEVKTTTPPPNEQVSLQAFFDFAIGACDCLEILHYGLKTVHGEIRGDAFHFCAETGAVKLANTGNGARSFDNVLSEGWSSVSRELGAKYKLQFIAPEQTGRMPTEPDSRTDIYALGLFFWSMLVGKLPFEGTDPVEVVQNVLGKRLVPVSGKRMDIPDAVSAVIQKMTQKVVHDRYHTISSVKRDLTYIAKLLGDGDSEALSNFQVAQGDVSSFFTLPTQMFGRQQEYDKILNVIEKVNRRQAAALAKAGTQSPGTMHALTSASSISDSRIESLEFASVSSDSGSFILPPRSSSNATSNSLAQVNTHESAPGSDTSFSTPNHTIVPDIHNQSPRVAVKSPSHSRSSHNTDRESHPSVGHHSQPSTNNTVSQSGSLHSIHKHKSVGKSRRSERCEVITISGPAGIGKTDLLNRIQPTVRKLGCIAITRLDRAKRVPFEPFAKLLASLLRQIFSERDVTTDYHNSVRMALRPMWPTLHRVLDLPEQLMSPGAKYRPTDAKASLFMPGKGEPSKHVNIPGLDQGQTSQDFFLANAASKNMRLMETFLEILRTLCQFKLITVCLDDLEHADDETLDLVLKIIKAKLPCVLILSSRKDEITSDQVKALFVEDLPTVTRIELEPLGEQHVMEIVAATMHQKPDQTLTPLCAVIQEKSRGNPFYVRVMLETCYRTNCIWYSWKDSKWLFDLDRIFTEFVAPVYGEELGLGFLTKRLQEIPEAARSIMIWGAVLGSPFSFSLVQKLLTSEFLYSSSDDDDVDLTSPQNVTLIRQSEGDIVVGLQFLVQANLLNPGKTDDEFRFGNERLAQAALSLSESRNVEKMHFIVSQALMKYYHDHRSRYSMAHHVALASQTIKSHVSRRLEYRRILWDAGQTAFQSGARPSALWYFRHCIALLQEDMWNDLKPDVYHDETMRLFITTSEMSWSQGHNDDALQLINEVFIHGKNAVSKSRAWIIKAKIYAQLGDHHRSMESLLTCLDELGVHLRQPTTYEECDAAYLRLKSYFDTADLRSIAEKPVSKDPTIVTIGTVMAEAMTVTYWDDALTFYRMALEVMSIHIFRGGFTQIAIGCSHLAMITLGRFKDIELGTKLSDLSLELLERCPELSTQSRGSIVHNLYVSHLRVPMASTLPALEASLEASFSMGDPYLTLISISSMAMTRLYLGQDMAQLETFCVDTPEEIPKWQQDTRGGASLIAVQQVARALQGKTEFRSPDGIMSDANHNTSEYMTHLDVNSSNADRPRDIYWGLAMIPLFLFGHHTRAIQVGTQLLFTTHRLWSARVCYVIYFYLAASLLTLHNDNPSQGHLDGKMDTLLEYKAEIDFAREASESNYGMWSLILEGLIAEVRNDHSGAIRSYESAIDHCQIHGWPLEEALALELQGEFLVRRGAKRAARAVIQDAIASWSSIGAGGKSSQLAEKHEWLLKTATSARTVDVGCQTMDSLLEISRDVVQEEILAPQKMEEDERRQQWIEQNGVAAGERSLDISSVGLDIIDLSSILESSQVMSSELQIDKLFTKMLEIILESCNGSDFAIIATEFDDNGFAIAAAGDSEKGQKSFPEGLPFSEMEDRMALHISDYVMRTKEEVLVHNVLEDERFSNVSENYLAKFPAGRSVIALPVVQGDRLLGVIHLEGKPNWFTQRNVVVLHLLCNQIGISLSNALLFREIRKVSAKNASMIESQKRALALAREAEQKAKNAEAEAKHNVKLKEDAARAKSIFLANISHDLRTPMNGVIGLSELLKGTYLDKEQDEYVESIRVCADTLLTLINDILDFSKLEAGKMKISTVPLNLKQTISEVIRALRYTHRDRGLETIENLDKVPPELVVLGDPVRLHQIFMNLLSNSYKFTPAGSVTVKAKVVREGKGRVRLECSVSDTGIGIPDEQKARLFRPFSQADASTERSYGGSGLGLSICKAIIEDVLGGAIWLESTSGVGTTVTFHLVFNKAPKKTAVKTAWAQDLSNAENEVRRASARDLTQIPRNQIRVCIAEDNPINQKIAVKFVTGLGLQCEAYSDGKQAVDALRASSQEGNPFHVVLMDVMMPTLDGYNATRELRRDPDPNVNEVLVIAMTASAIEGDREKCLEAGMNNYLPKPVRSPILSELLDRYLAPRPPSYPKSRLAIREKRSKASIDAGGGTPTSYSSSASDEPKPLSLEKK
ncbi:CheY-like superfamily [Penicillium coprophilum]|uniref:CheY-like superfamily n=1 Tax=Penicillium coprophilum TaxID=36646 RepID=UPI0023843830|nr:CheY-like superfamily [Penicillium coprophilum]KAJ5158598.1 CheY-like superfamily [Penicillium coprophilum]